MVNVRLLRRKLRMKKFIASMAIGAILLGIGITSVAAEEYEIVKGDNLWNIALENDTTVEYLMEVNNLEQTIIQPKQKIIIDHIYTVEKGDTLKGVAEEYDIEIKDVKERSEEHTSELQSRGHLVCRLLLEKKKNKKENQNSKIPVKSDN